MDINLRFGTHRDPQLIHQEKGKIDGLVIPAHILAYTEAATSVFVASMQTKPYLIDPMTFVFQEDTDTLGRASVAKLMDACFPFLRDELDGLGGGARLQATSFSDIPTTCKGVVSFQLTQVASGSASSAASKYLERYARTQATPPRCVVPPYFRFASVGDEWYNLSLACANYVRDHATDLGVEHVAPILSFPPSAINNDGDRDRLVNNYADFDRAILWVDDLAEQSTDSADLLLVRRLIRQLNASQVNTESLYGGFMLMIGREDGLQGVSHGILYAQHKPSSLVPGAGRVPERYYIPAFHQFRSLSQTDRILHEHPALMCDCEVCSEVLDGDPDNFVLFEDDPDLLRSHFLAVRQQEAEQVAAAPCNTLVAQLEHAFETYDASISQLLNPDAIVTRGRMSGLGYLREWASAYSQTI